MRSSDMHSRFPRIIAVFIFFVTMIAVIVPLSPSMPSGDIEGSWIFGLNQAIAQHLDFGKSVVFTFGPYASVYTRNYHPATDLIMMGGSLYLALSYFFALMLLLNRTSAGWLIAFVLVLTTLPFNSDAVLFLYPLLVTFVTYRIALPQSHAAKLDESQYLAIYVALLFMPLGLLPLIKGSMIIASMPIAAMSAVMFTFVRRVSLATVAIVSPLLSMVLFWLLTGQRLSSLPSFFLNMGPIVSGYTEAMSLSGNISDLAYYAVGALGILYLAVSYRSPLVSRIFLSGSIAILLFLSFKAGFVRHDAHVIRSAVSLLLVAAVLPFAIKHRHAPAALLLSLVCCIAILSNYVKTTPFYFFNNIATIYTSAFHGLKSRVQKPHALAENFDKSLDRLRTEGAMPALSGTADVYPWDISYLVAAGNRWNPRPILQSYSAYTPRLSSINADHLTLGGAPDHIFFRVETIDSRLPALDDGASWPALIFGYFPIRMNGDFVVLEKRPEGRDVPRLTKVVDGVHKFGEEVVVPRPEGNFLFAQIDIKQTIVGKLISILYKPSRLAMTVTMHDGQTQTYRIISAMTASGFVLSPLVSNTQNFVMLYADKKYLENRQVRSIRIEALGPMGKLWNNTYHLTLSEADARATVDIAKLLNFDKLVEPVPSGITSVLGSCEGNIDVLNGQAPGSLTGSLGQVIQLRGWLANSVQDESVPEAVYVTLKDKNGHVTYVGTHATPRQDVNEYFHKPNMPNTGYESRADIGSLAEGRYALGLSYAKQGKLYVCPQFNIPATITHH